MKTFCKMSGLFGSVKQIFESVTFYTSQYIPGTCSNTYFLVLCSELLKLYPVAFESWNVKQVNYFQSQCSCLAFNPDCCAGHGTRNKAEAECMKTFLTHAVFGFLHLCLIPLPVHVLAFVVLKHMPSKTLYESVRKLQKRGSKSSVKEGSYHRGIQQ